MQRQREGDEIREGELPPGDQLLLLPGSSRSASERHALLTRLGYQVFLATTAKEALRCLKEEHHLSLLILCTDDPLDSQPLLEELCKLRELPVLLFGDVPGKAATPLLRHPGVYGVLPADCPDETVRGSIEVALARFGELEAERERARKSETLLRAQADMLFLFNKSGIIEDYQATDPGRLIAPPERFLGRHLSEVLPAEHVSRTEERIRRVITSGRERTYQYEANVGGKPTRFEGRLIPYGKDRALSIVRDVSLSPRGRKGEEDGRADLFDLATFEGVVVHRDCEPVEVNSALSRLTGRSRKELLFNPVYTNFHPEDRERGEKLCRDGGTGEVRCLCGDGTYLSVEIESRGVDLPRGRATVTSFRDLSQRRVIESQLWGQIERMSNLLRDAYNQINGNLTTLESFLTLRELNGETRRVKALAREARGSVAAFRCVYEQLLLLEDSETLPAAPVIREITDRIIDVLSLSPRLEAQYNLAEVKLTTRTIFTVTTILSELLINTLSQPAVPHALTVELFDDGDSLGLVVCAVTPEGGGDPEFPLSRLVLQQIDGRLEAHREEGETTLSVRIPTRLTLK